MAKKRATGKVTPYVMLTRKLLDSKAYKELPASAAKLLPHFIGKVIMDKEHWHPDNAARFKVEFPFSYGEARHNGFGKATFYNVLGDLIRFGFIDLTFKGFKSKDGSKKTSMFRLSRRWESFGLSSFHDGDWKRYFPKRRPEPQTKKRVLEVNPISSKSELLWKGKGIHEPK